MNASDITQWGQELWGAWLLLGLLCVVIEVVRRIITDPRGLVKSVAHRVRIPLAIVMTVGLAFATLGTFLWHGDWWGTVEAWLMLVVGIAAYFVSAMAPILVLDKLLTKRQRHNQQPPQVQ
ncbi:MAG: hypothetical protein WA117_22780 [Verrucomicrobiia bacterium]